MPNETTQERTTRRVFWAAIAFVVGLVTAFGLAAAVHAQTPPDSMALEHGVRVGWVTDSVYQQLRAAVHRKAETRFMATSLRWGYWPDSPQQDSGVVITSVIECTIADADSLHVRAACPNNEWPIIHTHVLWGDGRGANSCSPSRRDLELQIHSRHVFDAIMCGDAPPTFYWLRANPLYGYVIPYGAKAIAPPSYKVNLP